MAKSQQIQLLQLLRPQGDFLADQVGAGYAQMDAPGRQLSWDFTGGEQDQLYVINAFHGACIFPVRACPAQFDAACVRAPRLVGGQVHQPGLATEQQDVQQVLGPGGHRDDVGARGGLAG